MAISYDKKKSRYPKSAALLIAFPSSGKTNLARNVTGVIDLDFGHFRAAFECSKRGELCIVPIFVRLIKRYLAEGWVVVTNEPSILAFLGEAELDITEGFLPFDERIAAHRLYTSVSRIKLWEKDWCERFACRDVPLTKLKVPLSIYFTKGQDDDEDPQDGDPVPTEKPIDALNTWGDDNIPPVDIPIDEVEKALVERGFVLRDNSQGLRSFPIEGDHDE